MLGRRRMSSGLTDLLDSGDYDRREVPNTCACS